VYHKEIMAGLGGKAEVVVALCKRRGFVFQGSEIYNALARPNFIMNAHG